VSIDARQPHSRYRAAERDDDARAGHAAEARRIREERAADTFPPETRASVLEAVAKGVTLADAAQAVGLTRQFVSAWAVRDDGFADELDDAYRAAAPTDTPHGTPTGYRYHRCRCRECRAAHHGPRG